MEVTSIDGSNSKIACLCSFGFEDSNFTSDLYVCPRDLSNVFVCVVFGEVFADYSIRKPATMSEPRLFIQIYRFPGLLI